METIPKNQNGAIDVSPITTEISSKSPRLIERLLIGGYKPGPPPELDLSYKGRPGYVNPIAYADMLISDMDERLKVIKEIVFKGKGIEMTEKWEQLVSQLKQAQETLFKIDVDLTTEQNKENKS